MPAESKHMQRRLLIIKIKDDRRFVNYNTTANRSANILPTHVQTDGQPEHIMLPVQFVECAEADDLLQTVLERRTITKHV